MAEKSKIEWTDSTFSPWIGCTKVSPACDHCYAERQDARGIYGGQHWGAGVPRKRTSASYWRQPLRWNAQPFWKCDVCGWRGDRLLLGQFCPPKSEGGGGCGSASIKPARRRVFCASLADWLDNEVPVEWLADLLSLIHATPNLDWLLLTKRIGNWKARMNCALGSSPLPGRWLDGNPPRNVWLGATVCNQTEVNRGVPKLLAVPARVRFLSIEPMLGPITFRWAAWEPIKTAATTNHLDGLRRLDWIICGGESGPQARPMDVAWAHSLRQQCTAAGVPFFMKQMGGNRDKRGAIEDLPLDLRVREIPCDGIRDSKGRFGKRLAGRMLDGVEHSGFPEVRHG